MGKKNIMLHNYSEESMEGRFEVNNSSEESMGKKIKWMSSHIWNWYANQCSLNLNQSQNELWRKVLILEMTSTLTDSAWGASHQSLKWSNLRMQQVDSAWIGKFKKCCWKIKTTGIQYCNSSKESIYLNIYIYSLISSKEMIISELLKGVMYGAAGSAGIIVSFFDAQAPMQLTHMQKCWPLTRPLSHKRLCMVSKDSACYAFPHHFFFQSSEVQSLVG